MKKNKPNYLLQLKQQFLKQQLRSKLNMNWNEAFDIAKDKNVWETLIKDCPM